MADLTRGQKVRLGLFVGGGLTVLFAATFLLAGRALLEPRDSYRIRFSSKSTSFSGLTVGSDVTYSGLQIGRVESLDVAADDVSVIAVGISVKSGTPIAEDSIARLGSQGITGMKYVDISRGSPGKRLRKPGELVPAGDSVLDTLTDQAVAITQKLDTLLVQLQAMTGAKAQTSMQQILDETSGILTDNRANIAAIVRNAAHSSGQLTELTAAATQLVRGTDGLLAELRLTAAELRRTLGPQGEAAKTLQGVQKLVDAAQWLTTRSQGDIAVILRHVRDSTADLADFSQAIKDNPSLLMFSAEHASDRTIGR
jgi:phospholipid/cholesterol/gamma-HCH transport system substrate-binding protein